MRHLPRGVGAARGAGDFPSWRYSFEPRASEARVDLARGTAALHTASDPGFCGETKRNHKAGLFPAQGTRALCRGCMETIHAAAAEGSSHTTALTLLPNSSELQIAHTMPQFCPLIQQLHTQQSIPGLGSWPAFKNKLNPLMALRKGDNKYAVTFRGQTKKSVAVHLSAVAPANNSCTILYLQVLLHNYC